MTQYSPSDLTELGNIMNIVLQDHAVVFDEDDFEHMFFASYHAQRYVCPITHFIAARHTVVEVEDVSAGLMDKQGITWREGNLGRGAYRNFRNRVYSSPYYGGDSSTLHENREELDYTDNEYYRFRYTDTAFHCSHRHPQLRNLVCATSKNDVYYLYNNTIQHWCPQLRTSKTILGHPLKLPHSSVPRRITTMAAKDDLLLVGGEDGSYTFMNLQTCAAPVHDSFTNGKHTEVNGIEISYSRAGGPHAFISTNDALVRCIDMKPLSICATYPTGWFANYTSQSPDGHMIGIVGDDPDGLVMSVNSREKIATLKGHQRYSFSVAWSPDSTMLATGSDDFSTCIYDTRMMENPVHTLSREVKDSIRSLRYSACGRYLVMAEDSDFVHIVDTTSGYSKAQKIDLVGDISGISLTPDGDGLFVGVSNVSTAFDFSSVLEFEKLYRVPDKLIDEDHWASWL
ncbi:WD40-repeat-containing domain protein [Lobosporangium transversale]|uniref:WD40-repeat-containing domain protein n=1 Tax=Lobosporangium transversale TaxID=64571 RepID=A0A1Y2GSZ0_9FUNG|nr:WD40-repeat-containing domain protein [Lobosporangium transversale]ORZ20825.1 WD40-repeat-containing domain protein [Lobosporangium transversale]|eukprot:XP_021882734.1 WD40-repeat-containing domain protein [Lobosporangium transversale]